MTIWITVSKYQELSDLDRSLIVGGVLQGIQVKLADMNMNPYAGCFAGKELKQLRAVFDKYLRENPEEWHYGLVSNLENAMDAFCFN